MPAVDELRAALAVAELEEQLSAEKARLNVEAQDRARGLAQRIAAETDPDVIAVLVTDLRSASRPEPVSEDLKFALREARRVHRELRRARPAGPGEVRPDTIGVTAGVEL
jgi:hypothetical protein